MKNTPEIEINIFKILSPLLKIANGERVSTEFAIDNHKLEITYRANLSGKQFAYKYYYDLLQLTTLQPSLADEVLFDGLKSAIAKIKAATYVHLQ